MARHVALVTLAIIVVMAGRAVAQDSDGVGYFGEPPEKLADVVVIFTPHMNLHLQPVVPGEQVIHGAIDHVVKGVAPQLIVNTPNTIVGPLHAGVPVRLFLKTFKDRNVHYIIGVYPEPLGGQP